MKHINILFFFFFAWYNRIGWLFVKHQFTYLLTSSICTNHGSGNPILIPPPPPPPPCPPPLLLFCTHKIDWMRQEHMQVKERQVFVRLFTSLWIPALALLMQQDGNLSLTSASFAEDAWSTLLSCHCAMQVPVRRISCCSYSNGSFLVNGSPSLISLMVSVDVKHHVYVNRSASTDSKHSTMFLPNWVV